MKYCISCGTTMTECESDLCLYCKSQDYCIHKVQKYRYDDSKTKAWYCNMFQSFFPEIYEYITLCGKECRHYDGRIDYAD